MDARHYARLDEVLRGLLVRFGDRLPQAEIVELANCLDRGMYGLALEWLADSVTELGLQVEADERAEILRLARLMGISEYVERALD
jgi:hypothetical protein